MLNKLLKYDFKWISRLFIPFAIITLCASTLSKIFLELDDVNLIFKMLYFTFMVLGNALIINLIFNIIIRNIVRFKSQLYGDESYLVHTLPVERTTVVKSKIISSIVTALASVFVGIVCFLIAYGNYNLFQMIKKLVSAAANFAEMSKPVFIVLMILYFVLMLIWFIELVYTALILGYRSNNKKTLKSLIYGVLMYMGVQVINVLGLVGLSLINDNIYSAMFGGGNPNTILGPILILVVILGIIYSVFFYFTNIKLIQKKLNVD